MLSRNSFVEGDTGSKLKVNAKDNESGKPLDLTGCTVTLRWLNKLRTATVARSMTIVDAVNGVAEYQFVAGELFAPKMQFEVRVTDAAGKFVDNLDLIEELIRPAMPTLP